MNNTFVIHKVSTSRGGIWIKDGWTLFKKKPGGWIATILLIIIAFIVIGAIPLVGTIVATFLGPMISVGLIRMAFILDTQNKFEMKEMFFGLTEKPGEIVLLTILNLALFCVLAFLAFIPFSSVIMPFFKLILSAVLQNQSPGNIPEMMDMLPSIFIFLGLIMLISCICAMASIFAPGLICLGNQKPIEAMKLSFLCCLKNFLPITVWGLLLSLLTIASMIPLFLGFLILYPVIYLSIYRGLVEMFRRG